MTTEPPCFDAPASISAADGQGQPAMLGTSLLGGCEVACVAGGGENDWLPVACRSEPDRMQGAHQLPGVFAGPGSSFALDCQTMCCQEEYSGALISCSSQHGLAAGNESESRNEGDTNKGVLWVVYALTANTASSML